jgi:hypothetical protein
VDTGALPFSFDIDFYGWPSSVRYYADPSLI